MRLSEQWIPFTCTLDCGSRCELLGLVRDGRLVRIDTSAGLDPLDRPRLIPCARGRAQRRWLSAENRVGTPWMRSATGELVRASWQAALDAVAAELVRVREQWGAEAIMLATGAGSGGGRGFSGASAAARLFSHWAAVTQTVGNLSHHSATWVEMNMLGQEVPADDRATLLASRLIVLWGNNPADTRMGPNTEHYIRLARDRGAQVVLIDPRLSDSGALCDVWLPIRPGTDAALVAGLVYMLETWGAVDRAFLESHASGYEVYQSYVMGRSDAVPKTPAWASEITGLPVERIEWLAQQFAAVRPASILPGWGPQRALWGEQFHRAMITLACVTGNMGKPGAALPGVGVRNNRMQLPRLPYGEHRAARTLHNASWAQAISQGTLAPPIKLAFIAASNLVNRSSNTWACLRALQSLDTVVVLDPFMTPTAKLADIVLPINTDLERSDVVTGWGSDMHLFASQQVAETPDAARSDYWVCAEIAQRLGIGSVYTAGKTPDEWLAAWRSEPTDALAALDGQGVLRYDGALRVALADFCRDPGRHPLPTASGRIEICSEAAAQKGLPRVPSYVAAQPNPPEMALPLQLLTPHHKLRANSGHGGNPWLRQIDDQYLWINPRDATARGLVDGKRVRVRNALGVVECPARVTERIMPGVVCLPQGAWFSPDEQGVDQAGSANVLTSLDVTPTGGNTTHSVWVEVERYD